MSAHAGYPLYACNGRTIERFELFNLWIVVIVDKYFFKKDFCRLASNIL